jgi:hypothetical protein
MKKLRCIVATVVKVGDGSTAGGPAYAVLGDHVLPVCIKSI